MFKVSDRKREYDSKPKCSKHSELKLPFVSDRKYCLN